MNVHILGIFDAAEKAAGAARALRTDGVGHVTAYAPAFDHTLDAAWGQARVLCAPLPLPAGSLDARWDSHFPIYTVVDWPIMTGGKAIVSLTPFVVIAFELTILFAALMTVAGFMLSSGLPRLRSGPYDPRFSQDRWGVLVTCANERAATVRAQLAQAGAEEVRDAK